MTEAARKQRRDVGRIGRNGELHVIADVVPFVSSRLGPIVSHETEREHDPEVAATARVLHSLGGVGQ